MIQELTMYMDSLAKLAAADRKLDREINEAIQATREYLGLTKREKEIYNAAKMDAIGTLDVLIEGLLTKGLMTEEQIAEIRKARWNIV